MKLNKDDQELINIATEVIKNNNNLYEDIDLHVACAVRGKSGKIYTGINICTSHSICAEQVAIGHALASGEREFETLASVKYSSDGSIRPISPCGLCRYTFDKLNLDMYVIVEDNKNNEILKVKAKDLLPYPYKRNK